MIWGWENPWFFCGLGALLVLLLLYFLKSRGKTFFTQALFLWEGMVREEKSSSTFAFRKLPLSFFLEALALLLMVCGGAALFVVEKEKFPPAVVLLNNSYSMDQATRSRGGKELRRYLDRFPGRSVVWALCGAQTELLSHSENKFDFEKKWEAIESSFDAPSAIGWAEKNFPGSEIILVTDRVPDNFTPDRATLLSCGRAGGNVAITAAGIREGRVLLETASFSDTPSEVELKVNSKLLEKFTLAPGEKKLFNFQAGVESEVLNFSIESQGDQLAYDNKASLLNRPHAPVSCSFGKLNPAEKRALEAVLRENSEFRIVEKESELLFTSYTKNMAKKPGNRVLFHHGSKSVIERQLPFFLPQTSLLAGLHNTSLMWPFYPGVRLPGAGVIFSSEGELVSLAVYENRQFDLHFNLDLKYSNLPKLPFWPGFFCNLADLCYKSRAGVYNPNVKSTETIRFQGSPGAKKLFCRSEGGTVELPLSGKGLLFQLKKCGIYTLDDGRMKTFLAVNPHVTELSDLRRNRALFLENRKHFGSKDFRRSYHFLLIAGALALLLLDQILMNRSRKK